MVDEHVAFPDLRIEYEGRDGRRDIEDVEVMTPHYRGAHAAAKVRAGFRKPTPVGAAIVRLMLLDAVLSTPNVSWLATEREKLAHFTMLLGTGFRREDLPRLVFGCPPSTTVRFFPDKLPIGTIRMAARTSSPI